MKKNIEKKQEIRMICLKKKTNTKEMLKKKSSIIIMIQ